MGRLNQFDALWRDAAAIRCCSSLPKQSSCVGHHSKCANAVGMNTRRDLLFMLGAGALLSPRTSLAQQQSKKTHQIGFLTRKKDASVLTQIEAFRQQLHDLGWIEGNNVNIAYRDADGELNRLDSLALELVNLNVDVIVTVDTPPTQAAKRATGTIPIVVAVSADPVGAGLVESLARPGGNTTGLSLLAPDTDQKTLEFLKEIIPEAKRVSMIVDPKNQGMMLRVEAIKTAASKLEIEFQSIPVLDKEALLNELVTLANAPPDALMVLSPIYAAYGKEILDFAAKKKVPICFDTILLSKQPGALLSYGANISDLFRRAAIFVDKILKGTAPADLPVEQPTAFELAVNLKTAKALGLTVPFSVLARADEVIE
jgi:putative tryptophan/tyrosine transport system substrate-binding protein